ncbi:hypothetical protein MUG91_G110n136 [Manis pentadactyla]|nr:hypothetical protein MUG91_G110n136 [Manis pentadactyla]
MPTGEEHRGSSDFPRGRGSSGVQCRRPDPGTQPSSPQPSMKSMCHHSSEACPPSASSET